MSDVEPAVEGRTAIAELEHRLGHTFVDRTLLRRALMHRSYAGEQGLDESYERLEFLGDAVVQLAVTRYLFEQGAEMSEGEMAKVRAAVVSEKSLAAVGRELAVGPALLLGKGEDMTGGRTKESLLSDVVEALIGAIFLEAGFAKAEAIVIAHLSARTDERALAPGERDYKTRLQEHLARLGKRPRYVVAEEGPEHAKQFTAEVFAGAELLGRGSGSSKKRAEQSAAKDAARRRAEQPAGQDDSPAGAHA